MNICYRLITASIACLISSCATFPTSSSYNPWQFPNRGYSISSSAEQARLLASMKPCNEYARNTFPEALRRYENGLLGGAGLIATVFDDVNLNSQLRVHVTEGELIHGHMSGGHVIKGKSYAAGDEISVNKADIVDWYIIHQNRPPEGNWLGRYLLLKQDGLAPGDCDPKDIEFQRYRFFAWDYSFVPPGTEGWELWGPDKDTDMTMQKKDKNLDEINTVSSSRYRISPTSSEQELIEIAKNLGRYGDEEGVRYNVVGLEGEIYPHRKTRCARSQHIVEDKQALLSKWGKRGFMIRDVQSLVCVHPADNEVAVVLLYLHRHHPGKRDPGFIDKANSVFESLAFTKMN